MKNKITKENCISIYRNLSAELNANKTHLILLSYYNRDYASQYNLNYITTNVIIPLVIKVIFPMIIK